MLLALVTGELCFHQYKATLVIQVAMSKSTPDGKRKVAYPFFASRPFVILSPEDIREGIAKAHSSIEANIDTWTREGSGWVVDCVEAMYVNIAKYQPLKGSSYIQLPDYLKGKQAIINVKNNDQQCLKWALLSALHPAAWAWQSSWSGFQVQTIREWTKLCRHWISSHIPKVEKQNNLAINVFGYASVIHPLYLTNDHTRDPINLLLITKIEDGKTISHYCWIKDINKLSVDQNNHRGENVLLYTVHFTTLLWTDIQGAPNLLSSSWCHTLPCRIPGGRRRNWIYSKIKVRTFSEQNESPYIIYVDTESIIKQPAPTPTQTPSKHLNMSLVPSPMSSSARMAVFTVSSCTEERTAWMCSLTGWTRNLWRSERIWKTLDHWRCHKETGIHTMQQPSAGFAKDHSNRTRTAITMVYGRLRTMTTLPGNIEERPILNATCYSGSSPTIPRFQSSSLSWKTTTPTIWCRQLDVLKRSKQPWLTRTECQ